MKKLVLLVLVFIASVSLIGCNNATEFKVDGEFTAFAQSVHSNNAQQVTMVTVTITGGKIAGYKIDARQAVRTIGAGADEVVGTADDTYSFAWNAQTKAELGFNYKMHYNAYRASVDTGTDTMAGYQTWLTANSKNEWHTQAALIEAYLLASGIDTVEKNETGYFTNIAGVTVRDASYTTLAAEAVQMAKDGKFQAIKCTGTDLYIASMTVNAKGEFSDLKLDVLQLNSSREDKSKFVWNTSTKQQLGFDYKMHYRTYSTAVGAENATMAGYQTWLTANNRLEWFQQANIITDYVSANGWNASLKAITATGRGVSLDGTTAVDGTAGVTILSQSYFDVLTYLFGKVAPSTKK